MKKLLLFLIVLMSLFLRFYKLDSYPALNADEAAIGYNAYSLILTGKDEHGNLWPIHFQSFNDYKPGLYFYLVIPFVKTLGLNPWAVRIPGAALGVATVIVLYFLVKEVFEDEKLALLSSFFLAISPWHIHFSRGGWEVNSATFFITTGVLFLIKTVKNPKIYNLAFSTLALALSLYAYHAARIIVPLLVFGLLLAYWKQVKQNLKLFLLAGVVALILIAPLVKDFTKGQIASRAAGVGLFADTGPLSRIQEQRGEHTNYQGFVAKVLHNKAVNYGLAFAKNWLEHYEGEFLFVSGDEIQRNKVPETGQMYLLDLVFLVAGLVFIAKKSKGWAPILIWLLVAPIGAALTFQSPHALRAQNMVIPLVVISAYGLICLSGLLHSLIKKKIVLDIIFLVFLVLFGWSFARYLHMYWFHMAKEYPYSSQYGVKELVAYVSENQDKYRKIWVTDRYDQPYIHFLFYLKYPPEKFQKEHTLSPRDKYGFSTVRDFDKFHFQTIDFYEDRRDKPNFLIVGTDEEIPDEANIVKRIYGTNEYLYFKAVAN